MNCEECSRLETLFRESIVVADRAQTELRCYFLMHPGHVGVSDLAEYEALCREEKKTADGRNRAYLALVAHRKSHG
jgi:hypothetical protein